MTTYKMCRVCHEVLPLTDYYRNKLNADGYYNICKPCHLEDCRQRYERNPEPVRQQQTQYYEANKEYLRSERMKRYYAKRG